MKLYYLMGRYCRTQDEARAHARATGVRFDPGTDLVHVPTDARGLVDYLNRVLAAARGEVEARVEQQLDTLCPATAERSGPPPSLALDDAWDELPLPRKLHFASLAVEEARAKVKP